MIHLEIEDLTSKFLEFYDIAVEDNLEPDARFQLWKQMYGFAALPPTSDRDHKARILLDECWDKYPDVVERLRGSRPSTEDVLNRVVELFGCKWALHIKIIVQ